MMPLLGILIGILSLFGQAPDSVIKAFTEIADWSLSIKILAQNLEYDGHYYMRSDCNFNYKELEYKSLIFNAGNMNDTISKYILNRIFSSEGKLNIKYNVKCNIY